MKYSVLILSLKPPEAFAICNDIDIFVEMKAKYIIRPFWEENVHFYRSKDVLMCFILTFIVIKKLCFQSMILICIWLFWTKHAERVQTCLLAKKTCCYHCYIDLSGDTLSP